MKLVTQLALGAIMFESVTAGICNALAHASWTNGAQANPQLKNALDALSKYAVATWYTDRGGDEIDQLLQKCNGQVPSIVIYGLPNKDCAAGFSSGGTNRDSSSYKSWVQSLVSRVGSREVIYVLEPDAIGLLSNNNCAKQNNYLENLKTALGLISSGNPNAKIYADVAAWADIAQASSILNDLKSAGRLNGITINTSNYKTNAQLLPICQSISGATGGLHCAFDTSRNYRGSTGDEWCNSKTAGIGAPPGSDTGNPLVDYNLWLKPPGESDGECTGRTADALLGPSAGQFFADGFTSLWNNGYFVDQAGLPKIGGSWNPSPSTSAPWSAPTSAPTQAPTAAPTTAKPTYAPTTARPTTTVAPTTEAPTTTAAPTTVTPEPTTETPEPTTTTPEPTTETPEPTTATPEPTTTTTVTTQASADVVGSSGASPESAVVSNPTTTAAPVAAAKDVSVQASSNGESGMSAGMIVMIAAVGAAGVVATVLAVMVIRKRNMQEKSADMFERGSGSDIVVMGARHGLETERCLQVL
ncbi:hypothetical protein AeMF1_011403 [Aphanomyces euteiches]|nr:hypothetical protein AeMF1_011403 [Aphanomyces euteiches]